MNRFIVTGTPRSATKYAAKLMRALGVACVHETNLRPKATVIECLRWYVADEGGESSWMAWTLLPIFPDRVPVLHTIRDPWDVIDSLSNRNAIMRERRAYNCEAVASIRDTIDVYCPEVWQYAERVNRAAAFVLRWNALIAAAAPHRFTYHPNRIDADTVWHILDYIGVRRTGDQIEAALSEVATDTNAGYTVVDMPGVSDPHIAQFVAEFAKEHGCDTIHTRRIKNTPDRDTPEQLAARMDPALLDEVNQYAAMHGYHVVTEPVAA